MKKLLFLLLIAMAFCSSIEEYNLDDSEVMLEGINVRKIWNQVKNKASQAKAFLKAIGIYDGLVKVLKTTGKYYGISYCTSKNIPQDICSSIVDFVLGLIK